MGVVSPGEKKSKIMTANNKQIKESIICVISGFRRCVNRIGALLGCYTA